MQSLYHLLTTVKNLKYWPGISKENGDSLTVNFAPPNGSQSGYHSPIIGFLQNEKACEVKEKEPTVNPFHHHHRTE